MWIRDEVLGAALGRKGKPVPAHWHWWRRPELACPECGHAMRSLRTPSLVFDRCPAHGLWFDAGELATFLRLAGATGGPALDDEAVLAVVTKHLGAARRRASQPRARRKRKPAE
ncbi:MAG: zf-TFIIB domain-containing protein [Kofleriaceae bacterium]|nr:zf-TFIIB domain-containing protein [Kofleriaceae bacterium]MCB9571322.1 zf-TFIIB domain-containing protein [Kofleriaceae bacterium]